MSSQLKVSLTADTCLVKERTITVPGAGATIGIHLAAVPAAAAGSKVHLHVKGNAEAEDTENLDASSTASFRWNPPATDTELEVILEGPDGAELDKTDITVKIGPVTAPGTPAPVADDDEGGGGGNNGGSGGGPSGGSTVVDIEVGVFDKGFALNTGMIAALVVVAITVIAGLALQNLHIPATVTQLGDNRVINGSFGERIAAGIIEATLALGGVVIVGGAWLAALETRGRLRHQDDNVANGTLTFNHPPVPAESTGEVRRKAGVAAIKAVGEAAGVVLRQLTTTRASVVCLVAGATLVLGSLWAATNYIPDTTTTTTTTTSTTAAAPETTATTAPADGPAAGDEPGPATPPTTAGP